MLRLYALSIVLTILFGLSGGFLAVCTSTSQQGKFNEAYSAMAVTLEAITNADFETPIEAKQWAETFLSIWLEAGTENQFILREWMGEPLPDIAHVQTGDRRVLTVDAVTVDNVGSYRVVTLVAQTANRVTTTAGGVAYVAAPVSWWKITLDQDEASQRFWAAFPPRRIVTPVHAAPPAVTLIPVAAALSSSDDPRWEQNSVSWLENFLVENIAGDFAFDRLTHPAFKGSRSTEGQLEGGVYEHFLRDSRYDTAQVTRMRMVVIADSVRVCLCEARVGRTNSAGTVTVFPIALRTEDNNEPRVFAYGDNALALLKGAPENN